MSDSGPFLPADENLRRIARPLTEHTESTEALWDLTGTIAGRLAVDPDLLATLGPIHMPAEKVLVPVDLRAYVAGADAEARADIAARTEAAADGSNLPPPFTAADPLAAGVHLHWAMPDSLCRADPESNDDPRDLGLPAVPDRWLVVRLGPPAAPAPGGRPRPGSSSPSGASPPPLPRGPMTPSGAT